MLLFCGLVALTLWLLAVVVRGPERWHRDVVAHLRPGAPEPTVAGHAIVFRRHALLLVVAACATFVVARAEVWPSNDALVEASGTAVDLVPRDELTARRFEAELRALVGPDVTVGDVSQDLPDPPPDAQSESDATYLQVRWTSPVEQFAARDPSADEAGDPSAACVVLTETTFASSDLGSSGDASIYEGPCTEETT